MGAFKTRAIVLRRADYRENDRMLTLLSPERGLLSAVSRGCKKRLSPLACASEAFAECEYVLCDTRGRLSVTSASVLHGAYALSLQYDKLTHGAYYLSLCEAACPPGEEARAQYALLRGALRALEEASAEDVRAVTGAYLARFADVCGFCPQLDACAECAAPVTPGAVLSAEAGGLLCESCEALAREQAAARLRAAHRPLNADGERQGFFALTDEQLAWLRAVLRDGYTQTGAISSPPLQALRALVEARMEAGFQRFSL